MVDRLRVELLPLIDDEKQPVRPGLLAEDLRYDLGQVDRSSHQPFGQLVRFLQAIYPRPLRFNERDQAPGERVEWAGAWHDGGHLPYASLILSERWHES